MLFNFIREEEEIICKKIVKESIKIDLKIRRKLVSLSLSLSFFLLLFLSCGAVTSLDFSSIIAVIVARSRNLIYATELINYTCAHTCAYARICMRQILFAKRQKIDCLALHLCRARVAYVAAWRSHDNTPIVNTSADDDRFFPPHSGEKRDLERSSLIRFRMTDEGISDSADSVAP